MSTNERLEEVLREIKRRKLKPKQIIENYGQETLKQIITYLNKHYGFTATDIAAHLNLASLSHFKELLKKLNIKLEKTWGYYIKPLPHNKTEELLRKAQQNPKTWQTIQYIKQHSKPPPWYNQLSEEEKAATILWLNHKEKQSLRKIAKTLKTTTTTISLLIKKHGAQPRKPHRKPITNPQDKAYLVGLRTGDLTVRMSQGSLVAQVGTTHYTAWHQLFQKLFSKYTSTIHEVARYNPGKKPPYEWNLYATLHPQDKWILKQPKNKIPEWIKQNKELFPAYLAGFVDSEGGWHLGSWRYNRPPGKGGKRYYRIAFSITNNNRKLLEEMKELLLKYFNIKTYVNIAHKAGERNRYSTRESYKLRAFNTDAVELAKLLLPHLKHPYKIERAKLAIKQEGKTLTQKEIEEWRKIRQKEKQQVQKDIELAKKTYQQKHKNPQTLKPTSTSFSTI